MEVRKIITKRDKEYNIVNEFIDTKNGFSHKSTLITNGNYEMAKNRASYSNRTWECYTYETCMSELIRKELESTLKSYITQYKEKVGKSRLTQAEKEQLKLEWEKLEYTQDLLEIKEKIKNRDFD